MSHSNIKTRKFSYPNLFRRSWYVPELARSVSVKLSASGLKVVTARGGLAQAILEEKDGHLSDHLLKLKRDIMARRRKQIRPLLKSTGPVKTEEKPEVAESAS